jgi:hypothetical protein
MPSQSPLTDVPAEEKKVQQVRDVQLEVVRNVGGRPLFLNARRFIRICRHIEQGESFSEACRLELVDYTGFRRHVKRNPKCQRRLKQAKETREDFCASTISRTFGSTHRGMCSQVCGGSKGGSPIILH